MNTEIPLLLSIPETAKKIGVGRTKIYELLGSNDLDSVRIGKRRLITSKSIYRFVENLRKLDGNATEARTHSLSRSARS
jgi:excisionase family DNA binding protein